MKHRPNQVCFWKYWIFLFLLYDLVFGNKAGAEEVFHLIMAVMSDLFIYPFIYIFIYLPIFIYFYLPLYLPIFFIYTIYHYATRV